MIRIKHAPPRAVIAALACAFCISAAGNIALGILAVHRDKAEAAENAALLSADLLSLSEAQEEAEVQLYAALVESRLPKVLSAAERASFTLALGDPACRAALMQPIAKALRESAATGSASPKRLRGMLRKALRAMENEEAYVASAARAQQTAGNLRAISPVTAAEEFCGVKYAFRAAKNETGAERSAYCGNLYLRFAADRGSVTALCGEYPVGEAVVLRIEETARAAEKALYRTFGYKDVRLTDAGTIGGLHLFDFAAKDANGKIGISAATGAVYYFQTDNKIHGNVLQ